MEADTPNRSATAPTFSASPTFLPERAAFFLRSRALECELEEGLDKDLSRWPRWAVGDLSFEYNSQEACNFLAYTFRFIVRFWSIYEHIAGVPRTRPRPRNDS